MSEIIVFTDGSYSKKNNKILCGYGVYFPNKEIPNISAPLTTKPLTSQRAELYAIYAALKAIEKYMLEIKNYGKKIIIYSDSQYSIKSLTIWIKKWKNNNWKSTTGKNVKNTDIIRAIDDCLGKKNVIFKHVRSHTEKTDFNSKGNEYADILAKTGANAVGLSANTNGL